MKVYDHSNEPTDIRNKLLVRDLEEAQIRIARLKASLEVLKSEFDRQCGIKEQYIQNQDGIIAVRSLCSMIIDDVDGKTSGKSLARTIIKLLGGGSNAEQE